MTHGLGSRLQGCGGLRLRRRALGSAARARAQLTNDLSADAAGVVLLDQLPFSVRPLDDGEHLRSGRIRPLARLDHEVLAGRPRQCDASTQLTSVHPIPARRPCALRSGLRAPRGRSQPPLEGGEKRRSCWTRGGRDRRAAGGLRVDSRASALRRCAAVGSAHLGDGRVSARRGKRWSDAAIILARPARGAPPSGVER